MTYFRSFPKIYYDINRDGNPQICRNLTAFSRINLDFLDPLTYYRYYDIQDGDRPDNVSESLYGTPDHYWTFFLINENLNNVYDDWPKGSRYFDQWVRRKYTNLAAVADLREMHSPVNDIAGKYRLEEECRGLLSNATGVIVSKFPTLGYVEIRRTSGTFRADGESILGITSEDSVSADRIVPMYDAPKYHVAERRLSETVPSMENGRRVLMENVIEIGQRTRRRLIGTRPVSILEYEKERETRNSRIRVIRENLINEVVIEFGRQMSL